MSVIDDERAAVSAAEREIAATIRRLEESTGRPVHRVNVEWIVVDAMGGEADAIMTVRIAMREPILVATGEEAE